MTDPTLEARARIVLGGYQAIFNAIGDAVSKNAVGIGISVEKFIAALPSEVPHRLAAFTAPDRPALSEGEMMQIANQAVERNLNEDGSAAHDSAQGFACAMDALRIAFADRSAGEVVVPREATQAMKEAATNIKIDTGTGSMTALNWEEAALIWSAMLDAAPASPKAPADVTGELLEAARSVVANSQRNYRDRRGKDRSLEDESGEAIMLTPHEDWYRLEKAVDAADTGTLKAPADVTLPDGMVACDGLCIPDDYSGREIMMRNGVVTRIVAYSMINFIWAKIKQPEFQIVAYTPKAPAQGAHPAVKYDPLAFTQEHVQQTGDRAAARMGGEFAPHAPAQGDADDGVRS